MAQLPRWAQGSAQKFFGGADRDEDKGNRRFKELEMSLSNEFNLEQNLEIVDKFVDEYLKNHYYAYAIHVKAGEMSGERHPYIHIMFLERLILAMRNDLKIVKANDGSFFRLNAERSNTIE